MRFSAVIPTYNRIATLRQTLEAVTGQTHEDYEVIVVDDGSTDGTADTIVREFPSVRLIQQSNRGPAAARNRGIEEASGDIVAFTDDDCVPPPDWLARLADGYARHPKVAGVGGSLTAPDPILSTSAIARYEQYVARTVYHAGDTESIGGFECPAGGTANMSYRNMVLQEVCGFNETFTLAAGEDADLKLRVCQKGHRLLYVPIWVTHLQEYSWARFKRQCVARGIGRNTYESLHGTGWPSRGKVVLRLVRRVLALGVDLLRFKDKPIAVVKFVDGIYTCRGQWTRLR